MGQYPAAGGGGGGGGAVDVTDRAGRALGAVSPAGASVWDISDRVARVLGVADISDRVARVLGVADISDRAGRALGAVSPAGASVWDISDRIARVLGVADVSDRAGRALGAVSPAGGSLWDISDRIARVLGVATRPQEWAVTHQPAVNVAATITKAAAGAGIRHVCTSITATVTSTGASSAGPVLVNLRDGATGVGTILWSARLPAQAITGDGSVIALTGLQIAGSLNTAMTLEFTGAGTTLQETVSLVGYDTTL